MDTLSVRPLYGDMKKFIDLMLPSNACYPAILKRFHTLDAVSGHRIPTMEAACASKFAALVLLFREWERKQQDVLDLRSLMSPNSAMLDRSGLQTLGDLVYPDSGQ